MEGRGTVKGRRWGGLERWEGSLMTKDDVVLFAYEKNSEQCLYDTVYKEALDRHGKYKGA